ncbi:MAG TPA: MCE family protein [Egibacteraceae bacterium]|nr:MCE family protein [Egibacteraceae bacterium]
MSDRHPAIKFGVFALVCTLCSVWLISVTGNIRFFARTSSYEAVMDDATGLLKRDSVLLAGVRVGTVEDVSVERGKAVVRFKVDRGIELRDTWEVGIRWRNVIGQRFLYLYPVGGGEPLQAGDRLPAEQSRPTADIGRFFERLTPLLEAIDPEQQNKLLAALNEALEGKQERIQELVADLGSLSSTLADREAKIRTVIGQGAALLDAYADRDQQIRQFLTDFADVSRTLRARNDVLVGAVADAGDVQQRLDELLRANDTDIRTTLDGLDDIASRIGTHRQDVENALATLKDGFATYMLISRWGQWFNVRAVATQVQNDGQVQSCQAEEGHPCEVPNSRPSGGANASWRVPGRNAALPRLVSTALAPGMGGGGR